MAPSPAERLNILMPSDVFPPVCGGAGWSAHALARALIDRGHQVTAIVPRALDHRPPTASGSVLGVRGGQSSRSEGGERRPAPSASIVLGVPVVDVPYLVPWVPFVANWYRHEWLWPLLRNVITREALRSQVDRRRLVIHAQHVQTVPGAILAGSELGAPVIATVRDHWPRDYFATGLHGGRLPYRSNTVSSLVTDLVARLGPVKAVLAAAAVPYMLEHVRRRQAFLAQADAVVAVSRYIARGLPGSIPPERVAVIPNMVDVAAVERVVEAPGALPVERPFLLFVGKLEYNKGAHLLPAVIAAARKSLADAPLPPLVVAGAGPLASRIAREIGAMGAEVRILPGWTDHDTVLRLMRAAEVLIFPSAWGEPLSRVPLEASAAGACIAAMATGGTPEIVEHGASGVLVRDAEELGRSVVALLADPERCERLRQGARRVARERFATEVVAGRFEALYRRVIEAAAVPGKRGPRAYPLQQCEGA